MVVLVESERNFYKSRSTSLHDDPAPRFGPTALSFCQHVVLQSRAFIVRDCEADSRTANLPAVQRRHIRAYAGLPIRNPEGEILGSFCALDTHPRSWTPEELNHLSDLRHGIEAEIATRLQVIRLDSTTYRLHTHLQAAQRLLTDLDHEVRTPLNAVVNLSKACADLALPPKVQSFVSSIIKNAHTLSHLLESRLSVACLETDQASTEKVPIELRPLLESSLKDFYHTQESSDLNTSARHSFPTASITITPTTPAWLLLNGHYLQQLIKLLVQYHVAMSTSKGTIQLHGSWLKPSTLCFHLSCDAYQLPPPEHSFTFPQELYEGAGFSPELIRQFVSLLKAHLTLSTSSSGPCFTLTLPALAIDTPALPRRLRLLAIDDDPTNLSVIKFLTRKLGHDINCATTGLEGLALLQDHPYDLILLDLRMPALDGFEVARLARRRGHTLPIIAVTADASEGVRDKALSSGMTAFMTKPIKRQELAALLAHHCPSPSQGEAGIEQKS